MDRIVGAAFVFLALATVLFGSVPLLASLPILEVQLRGTRMDALFYDAASGELLVPDSAWVEVQAPDARTPERIPLVPPPGPPRERSGKACWSAPVDLSWPQRARAVAVRGGRRYVTAWYGPRRGQPLPRASRILASSPWTERLRTLWRFRVPQGAAAFLMAFVFVWILARHAKVLPIWALALGLAASLAVLPLYAFLPQITAGRGLWGWLGLATLGVGGIVPAAARLPSDAPSPLGRALSRAPVLLTGVVLLFALAVGDWLLRPAGHDWPYASETHCLLAPRTVPGAR
ncbi:MAG: hypothetical protein D6729_16125 [Deltaproteobacteria bacterium]|nr:MAG: hypothetical protein D6729_16125 [Deltaproteobacteria bacterium]